MAQPPLLCEEGNALHRYVTVIMKSSTKTFGELLPNPSCAPGHVVGHFQRNVHRKTFCAPVGVPPTTNYSVSTYKLHNLTQRIAQKGSVRRRQTARGGNTAVTSQERNFTRAISVLNCVGWVAGCCHIRIGLFGPARSTSGSSATRHFRCVAGRGKIVVEQHASEARH